MTKKEFNFGDHDWEYTTDERPSDKNVYQTFICRLCGFEVDINLNTGKKCFYTDAHSIDHVEYRSCAEMVIKEIVK